MAMFDNNKPTVIKTAKLIELMRANSNPAEECEQKVEDPDQLPVHHVEISTSHE